MKASFKNIRILAPILLIFLSLGCNPNYKVIDYTSSNETTINDFSTSDSLFPFVYSYQNKLNETMNEVINSAEVDMEIGNPEGLLGNFVADLVLIKAQKVSKTSVDFCVLNNGGLRKPIQKGPITRGDIYELMPFENELVVLELSGEKVKEFTEFVLKKSLQLDARKAGVPVSGIRMVIKDSLIAETRIGLYTLDVKKKYTIVTSDYLSAGGDNMSFFIEPISSTPLNLKLRDVILEEIITLGKNNLTVKAQFDGRIRIQK